MNHIHTKTTIFFILFITLSSNTYGMYNTAAEANQHAKKISDAECIELCDLFADQNLDTESEELIVLNARTIESQQKGQKLFELSLLYSELEGLVTPQKQLLPLQKKLSAIMSHWKSEIAVHTWREKARERHDTIQALQKEHAILLNEYEILQDNHAHIKRASNRKKRKMEHDPE